MPSTQKIVERYEAIALVSHQMLDAAQAGDWSHFDRLENDCAHLIDELRHAAEGARLDRAQRRARLAALRRVLAADAQIRMITEPELHRIGDWLGMSPSEQAGA